MIDNTKKIYLTVKDFSVSKETFGLYRDEKYDKLITFPKPNPEKKVSAEASKATIGIRMYSIKAGSLKFEAGSVKKNLPASSFHLFIFQK